MPVISQLSKFGSGAVATFSGLPEKTCLCEARGYCPLVSAHGADHSRVAFQVFH